MKLDIFLDFSPPYFLRRSLIDPGTHQLFTLAGQEALRICPSLSLLPSTYPGYRCSLSHLTFAWMLEDLHDCTAHMSLTEPPPQPSLFIGLVFQIGSNVTQAGSTICHQRMTLYFSSSCLSLPSKKISGKYHYSYFVWCWGPTPPSPQPRTLCMLGKHSTIPSPS